MQNVISGGVPLAIKHVDKIWGGETWVVNNKLYCGKLLNLKKDYQCSIHKHNVKDETFYILKGKVLMEVFKNVKVMDVGDVVHIPPGTLHRFVGLDDSEILEISTEHMECDSVRVSSSGRHDKWKVKV